MNSAPSFTQGYARNKAESAFPQLWDGLIGMWVPFLGPSSAILRDMNGYGNDGVLTSMDPATDWVVGGNPRLPGYALNFDDTEGEYVAIGDNDYLISGEPFSILWWEKVNANTDTFPGRFLLSISGIAQEFLVLRSTDPTYAALTFSRSLVVADLTHQMTNAPTIPASVGIWRQWCITGVDPASATHADFAGYVDAISYPIDNGNTFGSITGANRIGWDGSNNGANAQIGFSGIYNRILTHGEIALDLQYPGAALWLKRKSRRSGEEIVAAGRLMSSLVGAGGLAGRGGIAGPGGGLAA